MDKPLIAVIGAGNLGSSIIGGLIANNHPPQRIIATRRNQEKLRYLQDQYHIQTTTDNRIAVQQAEIIVLAVKPQSMPALCKTLRETLAQDHPLIVSIAAGITCDFLQTELGDHAIVRCMPNTPAILQCGITALYANTNVSEAQRALATAILEAVGKTFWVEDENLLDVVTAISGSGPAYFYFLMETMQNTAVRLGLPENFAKMCVLQTALGAALLANQCKDDLKTLREQVTSPGGTTASALSVLEEKSVAETIALAITTAYQRAQALRDPKNLA